MSKIDYKALCLKQDVLAVMPSKESRHMSEATKMVMGIVEVDGKETLHVETRQPSYELAIVRQLQPDSSKAAGEELVCVTDNDRYVEADTDTLRGALHSMGEREVTLELMKGGMVEVRPSEQSKLVVKARQVEAPAVPGRLQEGVVLRDFRVLMEALRAAVETAGVVGNEAEKCCVHLHLTPDSLIVEGCNPHAICSYEAHDVYDRAPKHRLDMALSVDCATRLVKMLATQECTEVRMAETEEGNLAVQAGHFTMLISKQRITCPDLCEERDRTYSQVLPVERRKMLEAVRTLKGMREKEADMLVAYDEVVLTGVANRMGEATMTVSVLDGKLPQGIRPGTCRTLGRLSVDALITALAVCTKEEEARLQMAEGETGVCIDCGNLRMVIR